MKRRLTGWLLLCALAVSLLLTPARAASDTWAELAVQNETVTVSPEDAVRYRESYERLLASFGEAYLEMISLLEHRAQDSWEAIRQGHSPGAMYHWLPTEGELSEAEALTVAYAYLEQHGLFSPDDLDRFFPFTAFFAFEGDDVHRVWQIHFLLQDGDEAEPVRSYTVYVRAADGAVVRVYDQDDAAG